MNEQWWRLRRNGVAGDACVARTDEERPTSYEANGEALHGNDEGEGKLRPYRRGVEGGMAKCPRANVVGDACVARTARRLHRQQT